MKKRYLVVGVLFAMTVACQPHAPDEEDATERSITSTATSSPPTRPSLAPRPTATSFATAAGTRGLAPADTLNSLQIAGGPALGYQLSLPESWVNAADMLRTAPAGATNTLFWADERATVEQLLGGREVERGAFVLAYLLQEQEVTGRDAVQMLTHLLAEGDPVTTVAQPPVTALTVNGVAGGTVEIVRQPVGLEAEDVAPLKLRILLLLPEQLELPLLIQWGASSESWPHYQRQFSSSMRSIVLHDLNVALALPKLDQPVTMQGQLVNRQVRMARLSAGHVDVWTFGATSGQHLTLRVGPSDSIRMLDLNLTLLTPSGKTRLELDNGYGGDTETITDVPLEETGRYILLVRELTQLSGAYHAHMMLASAPQYTQGGMITIGEVVQSRLLPGREQRWHFTGSAGQIVNVVLTPESETLDAILELTGPTDEVVMSLDEGFSGDSELISNLALPITGEYQIRIYEFSQVGGSYILSVSEGQEQTANFHDAGDLPYAAPQSEMLNADEVHAWFFTGLRADTLTIEVTPVDANLDLEIWLLDPDLNRQKSSDLGGAGQPEMMTHTLEREGQHILLVREFSGLPGNYQVQLTYEGNQQIVDGGTIRHGEVVTQTVASENATGVQFAGEAGDVITVEATPLNEGDLVLMLRDPSGNVMMRVNENLMGEAEQLPVFILTSDGQWQIIVREFYGRSSDFTLALRQLE